MMVDGRGLGHTVRFMSNPHGFIERLAEAAAAGAPLVSVTLVEASGSTPQDAGTKMLVTQQGIVFGTVGGGRVEEHARLHAQQMLSGDGARRTDLVEWNLKRDLGMTCGGTVKLFFESYNHGTWKIVVFGAGHVAQALARCLLQLDCQVTFIDSRQEWLDKLPTSARFVTIREPEPPDAVAGLSDDDFVICMTMGHRTDEPILEEIFRRGKSPRYLGVIGSRAKKQALVKELTAAGIDRKLAAQFHCPIGLDLGSNQPGEIAISITAQLIQQRDALKLSKS